VKKKQPSYEMWPKSLKRCEIKGGSQEMVVMAG